MARRHITNAVRSAAAQQTAVGVVPTWASVWDAETTGNLLRTLPLARRPAALELGERVEFPAGGFDLVEVARPAGGLVSGVLITEPGAGYTSAPTVAFSGGGSGSGAAATAVIAGGIVTDIIITNPGSGYTSAPNVAFSGGGSPTTPAEGTALLNGVVTEANAARQLAGETASSVWVQLHTGDPGTAGTANAITIPRFEIENDNWTAV